MNPPMLADGMLKLKKMIPLVLGSYSRVDVFKCLLFWFGLEVIWCYKMGLSHNMIDSWAAYNQVPVTQVYGRDLDTVAPLQMT